MPRDYARTSRSRTRAKRRGKGLWTTVIILIVLFAVGLFYLKQQSHYLPKTTKATTSKVSHKKTAAAVTDTSSQQDFDFYTILRKNQMDTSQINTNNAAVANQSAASLSAKSGYIVQIGDFKEYSAADELKAQVVLQGYEVNVTAIKKDSKVLYRVWLGPYQTREQALQQQKNLLENQIKSVIITLKKT